MQRNLRMKNLKINNMKIGIVKLLHEIVKQQKEYIDPSKNTLFYFSMENKSLCHSLRDVISNFSFFYFCIVVITAKCSYVVGISSYKEKPKERLLEINNF